MAVARKKSRMLREYWPQYKRIAIGSVIISQFFLVGIVALALTSAGFTVLSPSFALITGATLCASIALNTLVTLLLLSPLRDITAAITHASGEPSDVIPPNPNTLTHEHLGFKPLLQYIYEHGNSSNDKAAGSKDSTTSILRALDQTSAGVIIFDSNGAITYANNKAPITVDAANNKTLELLFENEGEFKDWLTNCQENSVHAEKTWLRVANKIVGEEGRRIFDISASYEKASGSDVIMVLFDRTDTYRPEDDSLDFIAFAAHELRGPITVIRGYLDVLNTEIGSQLNLDQQELIKRLIVSANRLSGYINNILNVSKYDRRHLKLHLVEDSLEDIYTTISDDLALRAQSQNRLLAIDIPSDLPTIAADRSSLSEVISNLVDNAIKYSNEGGAIAVRASLVGTTITVEIEDHGIGMPSNVVSNLFHKFYRSHRSRETVSGTGIGLYITKAIVESHGGTISVRSQEGVGSVFSFTIPTYDSVKDKLIANNSLNSGLISQGGGWIKNHSMYKS